MIFRDSTQESCASLAGLLKRMRVLLIDDDSQLNRLASFALRGRGMSVVSTTVPSEGLRLAGAEDFDLVLLDVMMPELEGPAVLHRLRAAERTRRVPVIFMSANDVAVPPQTGVRGFIRKPFDPACIADEVLSLLGRSETVAPTNEIPRELRRSFLVSAVERIGAIDRALDGLQRQPGERSYLREARAEFHRIAGAAASYGFAPLSEAASYGEMECDAVAGAPDPVTLRRWRDLLQEMRRHLSAAGVEIGGAGRAASRLVRLLCIDADPATEASLRLLDADSMFAIEFSGELPEGGAPDVLVVKDDDAGFAALETLRSTPQGRRTAVLMITTRHLGREDVARVVRAEVDDLLTEGADAPRLLGSVRALVERKLGQPPRVLCIGMEQHASSFASVIESAGYAVRVASTMVRAEIDIDTFEPDLVLAGAADDPDVSRALVRSVHLRVPAPPVPVVLVGSRTGRDLHLHAARAGAAGMLQLPISRGLLLATIQNHIAATQAHKRAVQRDPLTGCLSEAYFRERLQRLMRSAGSTPMLTLALLESSGSAHLLLTLSDLLRRRLRETDEVARWGQHRLIVLMEGISEETARALYTRLREEYQVATGQTFQVAIVRQGHDASAARWIAMAEDVLGSSS
jgi:two-component system OmpR family response regulator